MRAPFLKTLPALLAALVLALCSGCAGLPVGFAAARAEPVVQHLPTSPADISGIRRGAGEADVVISDEAWGYLCALAVLAVVFVLYGLVWAAMQIYDMIDEALDTPPEDMSGASVPNN